MGQVPGCVPAGPRGWFQPCSGLAGRAGRRSAGERWPSHLGRWTRACTGHRQPREPPSNCCAQQRRPGGLGGSSSAVSGRGHGEGALGTAGARRGALPPVPPWNHPHFSTFLVCRLIETIFSQVCVFFLSNRTATRVGDKTLSLKCHCDFPRFYNLPRSKKQRNRNINGGPG